MRRINVSQQYVNRILERDTVEINKLLLVSQALEFNFFQLFYSSKDEKFTGKNTAVAYGGGFNYAHVGDKITNGDAAIAELKMTSLDELLKSEKERSVALKDTLDSKKYDYFYVAGENPYVGGKGRIPTVVD